MKNFLNETKRCLICGKEITKKYNLCKDCYYNEIDVYNELFDEFSTVKECTYKYYNIKKSIEKLKNKNEITEAKMKMFALSELCLAIDEDETTLYENVKNDLEKIDENIIASNNYIKCEIVKCSKCGFVHLNNISCPNCEQEKITSKVQQKTDGEEFDKKIERIIEFRKKNQPQILCEDGDRVRSRAEKIIDDFFSLRNIKHIYEKRVPIDEIMYCDFYLPDYDLYIEFWGMTKTDYIARKEEKTTLYNINKINFLDIEDKHIEIIIDVLEDMIKNKIKKKQ